MVCIDLDHFKEVNDTLTHIVGDKLLVAVAARMSACLRAGDHLARFGGDEFVLILPALDEKAAVAEVSTTLQRLTEVVAEPYEIDSDTVIIGMSAGVAIAPDDGDARDNILRAADLALYEAKNQGRAFPLLRSQSRRRRPGTPPDHSRHAQGAGQEQFFLEYQPIVDLDWPDRQLRSLVALAPSDPQDRPGEIHPDRGRSRHDRRTWPLGAEKGVPRRRRVA